MTTRTRNRVCMPTVAEQVVSVKHQRIPGESIKHVAQSFAAASKKSCAAKAAWCMQCERRTPVHLSPPRKACVHCQEMTNLLLQFFGRLCGNPFLEIGPKLAHHIRQTISPFCWTLAEQAYSVGEYGLLALLMEQDGRQARLRRWSMTC